MEEKSLDSRERNKVIKLIPPEHRLPGLMFFGIESVFVVLAYDAVDTVRLTAIVIMGLVACFFLYLFFVKSRPELELDREIKEGLCQKKSHKLGNGFSISCFKDEKRHPIIREFKPAIYFPLKHNFMNLVNQSEGDIDSKNIGCKTHVFPYVDLEKIKFIPKRGFQFYGENMLTVNAGQYFPLGKEARTFNFAIYPTEKPKVGKPMFFFSYGKRKTHSGNSGYSNHDKSFGLYWGEPSPNDDIPEEYQGSGLRAFFYCEHRKKDRTSGYCDSKVISAIQSLNEWCVLSISYDGNIVKVYIDGLLVHAQEYDISTSRSSYLNIGGFVHHDEDGGILARDLDYSMHGYIREFMMFRSVLSESEIRTLSVRTHDLL